MRIKYLFSQLKQEIFTKSKSQIIITYNITKTYKQFNHNVSSTSSTNLEAKHITKKLQIANRVECMARKPTYITLKEHKENFKTNP